LAGKSFNGRDLVGQLNQIMQKEILVPTRIQAKMALNSFQRKWIELHIKWGNFRFFLVRKTRRKSIQ